MISSSNSPQQPNRSGSPNGNNSLPSGEPAVLAVGRLRRAHGIHGEIQMDILTDFPERLKPRAWVLIGPEHLRVQIRSVRPHDRSLLISFKGYDTPEEVGEFRNKLVFVRSEDLPDLEEGEYYHHQLIGLDVYLEDEKLLGKIAEIIETGSNDVLIVRPDSGSETGHDILIPLIDDTILEINLEKGLIRFQILPGLLE